jgi:hypothetical protein
MDAPKFKLSALVGAICLVVSFVGFVRVVSMDSMRSQKGAPMHVTRQSQITHRTARLHRTTVFRSWPPSRRVGAFRRGCIPVLAFDMRQAEPESRATSHGVWRGRAP